MSKPWEPRLPDRLRKSTSLGESWRELTAQDLARLERLLLMLRKYWDRGTECHNRVNACLEVVQGMRMDWAGRAYREQMEKSRVRDTQRKART